MTAHSFHAPQHWIRDDARARVVSRPARVAFDFLFDSQFRPSLAQSHYRGTGAREVHGLRARFERRVHHGLEVRMNRRPTNVLVYAVLHAQTKELSWLMMCF